MAPPRSSRLRRRLKWVGSHILRGRSSAKLLSPQHAARRLGNIGDDRLGDLVDFLVL